MRRKVDMEELKKAVASFLKANGGFVEPIKFKQFLRRFGYKPSYIKYVMQDLKMEGVIETEQRPGGYWIVKLSKEYRE